MSPGENAVLGLLAAFLAIDVLLFHHAPSLGRRAYFFGVAVSLEFSSSAGARRVLRDYQVTNLAVGIVAGLVAAAAAFTAQWQVRYGLRVGIVLGALLFHALGATIGYVRAHRKVHALLGRSAHDERHWIWGLLYFNPGDPALQVEKRFGEGYTLNFARPATWLLLSIPLFIGLTLLVIVRLVR